MLYRTKILAGLGLFLIFNMALANQEYVMGNNPPEQQPTNAAPVAPLQQQTGPVVATNRPSLDDIYVMPKQQNQQQPATVNNAPVTNNNAQASAPTNSNVQAMAPSTNSPSTGAMPVQPNTAMANSTQQVVASNNTQNSVPMNPNPQPVINNNTVNPIPMGIPQVNPSPYTDQEKQAWLNNCRGAVTNQKVSAYSEEFCECGWDHIASGQLPANLLTSNNTQDINKANSIISVISQECIVAIVSKHNLQ